MCDITKKKLEGYKEVSWYKKNGINTSAYEIERAREGVAIFTKGCDWLCMC